MSVSTEEIRRNLDAKKSSVKTKYIFCVFAARKLIRKHTALLRAEDTREIKNSTRANKAYARAQNAFDLAKAEYFAQYKQYNDLVKEVVRYYNDLIELEDSPRVAKKFTLDLTKFESKQEARKESLANKLCDIAQVPEERPEPQPVKESYDEEPKQSSEPPHEHREERRDYYAPPYYPYTSMYPPQIAPASIDISGIVEDSVRVAMSKFVQVFEKRMDEYEAALKEVKVCVPEAVNHTATKPTVASSEAGVDEEIDASAISELESALVGEEERIVEKLREVLEKLESISGALSDIGAAAIELAGAQSEAAEEQKRVNDMQRRTARDLQGIVVNQKLISGEVAELVGSQAAAIEEQKANIENQKLIGEAQAEIAEMEKIIIEAGATVNESAKELIAAQKTLMGQQASLINANNKNVDAQRELAERQAELTSMQKALEKEHKALLKKSAKVKSHGDKKSAPESLVDEAEYIVSSSDGSATVPEEVDLDSIKNED